MRRVLERIGARTADFERHALFAYLRDPSKDPRQRLSFVPALAHFVMTFADIYALILRDEPTTDRFQELVNAHTHEDGGHWRWFLADLDKLGHDVSVPFSEALRLVWSDALVDVRMLSYRICRLGLGADSLRKLVLVQCIEATGKVTLEHVTPVGREIGALIGKNLVYFGPHHLETESDHTLEEDGVRRTLRDVELGLESSRELSEVVDACFASFTLGADALLRFARRGDMRSDASARIQRSLAPR